LGRRDCRGAKDEGGGERGEGGGELVTHHKLGREGEFKITHTHIKKRQDKRRLNIKCMQVEMRRIFKRQSSAEHGVMPALTHWVNLLLPGGDL